MIERTVLAVSRWIEAAADWSIKKLVKALPRYRTIEIQAGAHTINAADHLPDDVQTTLDKGDCGASAH